MEEFIFKYIFQVKKNAGMYIFVFSLESPYEVTVKLTLKYNVNT